jgi:hypothetical protein
MGSPGARAVLVVLTWILIASAAGSPCRAAAGTLYGLSSDWVPTLYTIDASTGQATPVAPLGNASYSGLVGLDFLHGTLYATDINPAAGGPQRFGTIDINTALFTPTPGNQGGSVNLHGLAADEDAGVFFSIAIDQGKTLKQITPAGVVTTIGPTGIDGRGMAYDNAHGILYATDTGDFLSAARLYRINTATAVATYIGNTGVVGDYIGLAYDEVDQTLYLNNGNDHNLYRVDPATAAATLVGTNGVTVPIDGLAWLNPALPEPAGALLVIPALFLLMGTRPSPSPQPG